MVAKDFERIIYDQLYVHLTKYNLFFQTSVRFPFFTLDGYGSTRGNDSWAVNTDRGLINAGGKMRDPGNEVANAVVLLDLKKAF